MSQIDDAIAAAEAAAEKTPAAQVPATQEQGGALASGNAGPVDMSLGGFLKAGGIAPDKWIQVKDTGFRLDKNVKELLDKVTVDVDFANVKLFQGLRVALPGNKYEYIKTYDGRTEAKTGQNWGAAVADANNRAVSANSPYRGADILMTLPESVKQGKTEIPAGTKLGYTTSITGFSAFQSFLASLIEAGDVTVSPSETLSGQVRLNVLHESKSNADYEWGILTFEKA